MRIILILIVLVILSSCAKIEFVYKDSKNLKNPLYNKTEVTISGKDLAFMKSYTPMFFGFKGDEEFKLFIQIKEKQTKSSVETNQTASDIKYELRFFYKLINVKYECVVYEKQILSSFSILPKSSGYNYGSDASLEKKYELSVTNNLNQFVNFISEVNLDSCK
tara:strand:- start:82 stop:570 length:489 start_codon:yes stop_codon:yes gene_type:complete